MSVNFTPNQEEYKNYKSFGTFKMFVLENFPFIAEDFDSMTYYQMLCKVVEFLQDAIENNKHIQNNQSNVVDAFNELQNYVNTYFDNLDVQKEINKKLDSMAQNGVLQELINNYFEEFRTYINSIVNDQNVAINHQNFNIQNVQNENSILNSRINEMTKLAEGSTTGDAELVDIRVGANGETYDTAGDSVRSQFKNIHDILGDLEYKITESFSSSYAGMYRDFEISVPAGSTLYCNLTKCSGGSFKNFIVYGFREDGTNVNILQRTTMNEYYMVKTNESFVKIRIFVTLNERDENERFAYSIFGLLDNKSIIAKLVPFFNEGCLSTNYGFNPITDSNIDSFLTTHDFNNIYDFKTYFFYKCTVMLNSPADELEGLFYSIPYKINKAVGVLQYYVSVNNEMYYRISWGNDTNTYWSEWTKVFTKNEFTDVVSLNKKTAKIFKKVCCVGDSYTAGYIVDSKGVAHGYNEDYAWPHYMSTLTGNEYINCGVSGANAKTWQENAQGLQKAKNVGQVQAYLVGLAINDASDSDRHLEVGTIEDIGTTKDTYYAQYSKLIRELNTISPNAKIFLQTCPKSDTTRFNPYNQAILDIAEQYKDSYNVHVLDLRNYSHLYNASSITQDAKSGHYTAIGYEQFADILEYVMSDYINNNINEFQDVAFI